VVDPVRLLCVSVACSFALCGVLLRLSVPPLPPSFCALVPITGLVDVTLRL
jgi:hypothetical protein